MGCIRARASALVGLLGIAVMVASVAKAAAPADKPCRGKKCNPSPNPSPTPTPTPTSTSAAPAQVVGGEHFAALLKDGAVSYWGFLGNREPILAQVDSPAPVPGFESDVKKIVAGPYNLCAIKSDDSLWCLGENDYFQMGLGESAPLAYTAPVKLMEGVKSVHSGWYYFCAILLNDDLKCWGANFNGYFGNGSFNDIFDLTQAPVSHSQVQGMAGSESHLCILTNGAVKCAGYNSVGLVGVISDNSDVPNFTQVPLPGPVAKLVDGYYHTCARLVAGPTYCWGFGSFGEIGNGLANRENKPAQLAVMIPADAEDVFAQNYRTCFKKAGVVSCVGLDNGGALANASAATSWQPNVSPLPIQGLLGAPIDMIRGVSGDRGGNFGFACMITTAGLECWGGNQYGQVGNGSKTDTRAPQLIRAF